MSTPTNHLPKVKTTRAARKATFGVTRSQSVGLVNLDTYASHSGDYVKTEARLSKTSDVEAQQLRSLDTVAVTMTNRVERRDENDNISVELSQVLGFLNPAQARHLRDQLNALDLG